MKFDTRTVKGHGRGKALGFPTVNMVIPDNLPLLLKQGVYAARAVIKDEKYVGALYYGPAVTFGETEAALEIYLFDTAGFYIGEHEPVSIESLSFIRPVMHFELPEQLIQQMEKDEKDIRKALHQ